MCTVDAHIACRAFRNPVYKLSTSAPALTVTGSTPTSMWGVSVYMSVLRIRHPHRMCGASCAAGPSREYKLSTLSIGCPCQAQALCVPVPTLIAAHGWSTPTQAVNIERVDCESISAYIGCMRHPLIIAQFGAHVEFLFI